MGAISGWRGGLPCRETFGGYSLDVRYLVNQAKPGLIGLETFPRSFHTCSIHLGKSNACSNYLNFTAGHATSTPNAWGATSVLMNTAWALFPFSNF